MMQSFILVNLSFKALFDTPWYSRFDNFRFESLAFICAVFSEVTNKMAKF